MSAVGAEFQVNTYTDSDQRYPSVTSLSDGGWVVTWTSTGQDGSRHGIYGQRYGSDGQAVGAEFQVNTYTESSQSYPSVTSLSDGGWVVTWQSNGQDGYGGGIYGQRYDANGETVWGEVQVDTYTSSYQEYPSVTSLSDGGWVVTWSSYTQDGSSWGIYGQRYNADGQRVRVPGHSRVEGVRVNTYTNDDQQYPSVTSLTDGGWVVTWMSNGQDGSSYGIYGQRYDANSQAVGTEFQVNTYTNSYQNYPSVTSLSDGGWVVTWESWFQDGSYFGIYGQRYGSDGEAVGTEFRVNMSYSPSVGQDLA